MASKRRRRKPKRRRKISVVRDRKRRVGKKNVVKRKSIKKKAKPRTVRKRGRGPPLKRKGRIPKGWVEVKRLPGFSPLQKLQAELKRTKKKLKITEKKLRQARVKKRVEALKERAKKRRNVPKLIRILGGLDEYSRIRAIRDILGSANNEAEYWELVDDIAEELEITTHNVLLYMYIRD